MKELLLLLAVLALAGGCRHPAYSNATLLPQPRVSRSTHLPPTEVVAIETMKKTEPTWKAQLEESVLAFKNRKIYSKLTPEILATIPDDKLELAILDFIDQKVSADRDREEEIIRQFSEGFRAVHSTWWVEAEVNNGGFNQYFWNSSGRYAADAVSGFKLIGASDLAQLMERAITLDHEDRKRIQKFKKRATIKAFSESYEGNRLNKLDKQFYEVAKDLRSQRIKFIRSHVNLFVSE